MPLDVHLYVTPRCNLSCPHCYYDAYDRSRHPDNLISLDEIAALLGGLTERFESDVHLEGGEPFLRVGLDRMLADLDPDVLRTITVTTNGTVRIRSAPEVLRELGQLRISVDGHTDELQQELRGVKLAKVMRSCRELQDRAIPFTIRMTLWKRNVRQLSEIYAWVEGHGIEQLSFYEYQASGRGIANESLYGVSSADFEVFLDDLAGIQPPSCLRRLTFNFAERRLGELRAQRDRLESSRFALREFPDVPNCTINYDGTVGVSPWRVTAHGAPDVFMTTGSENFFDELERRARAGALSDDSGCVSRAQIRLER